VDKVGLNKELKRPVNGRWRGTSAILFEAIKNIVGADRFVAVPDQLKNPFPLSGEPQTTITADQLRVLQSLLNTAIVVMPGGRKSTAWICFAHRPVRLWWPSRL